MPKTPFMWQSEVEIRFCQSDVLMWDLKGRNEIKVTFLPYLLKPTILSSLLQKHKYIYGAPIACDLIYTMT